MLRYRNLLLLLIFCLAACDTKPPVIGSSVPVTVWKDTVGAITAMDLHPDGRLLATGTSTGAIRIWDIQTGQIASSYNAHTEVTTLAYNREGTYLATGGTDKIVRLWDTKDNRFLVQSETYSGNIAGLSWFKDGTQRLLVGSDDLFVRMLDMNAKAVSLKEYKAHSARITGVSYIPNTRTFASASADKNLVIWDIRAASVLKVITESGPITAMRSSPDGKTLAVGLSTGLVKLYGSNPYAKPPTPLGNVFGGSSGVLQLAWNPDGSRIAVSFADNTVRIYEPSTGLQVGILVGHTSAPISVIWLDKNRAISADREGYIRTWDVSSLKPPAGKPTATPTPNSG